MDRKIQTKFVAHKLYTMIKPEQASEGISS